MATCLIALGANLGDRQAALDRAVGRLRKHPEIGNVTPSRWVATDPVGGPACQGEFLNGAVRLETSLAPDAIFAVLRGIQCDLGRVTSRRWAPRPIDLDLLLYDQRVIDTHSLVVPHPRMSFRRFVLVPAVQIAREMVHPTIGWTLGELLHHLDAAADFVAIAGPAGAGKTWLAKRLCGHFHSRLIARPAMPVSAVEPGADWAGRAYATEIRFLEDQVALLAKDRWRDARVERGAAGLAVSDFWLDQGLAHAGYHLTGKRLDRFRAEWDRAIRQVVRPKLLVVVDVPAERPGDLCPAAAEAAVPGEPLPLRRAILDHARRPGHGPTLWLAGRHRNECLEEAVAAVEALR